MRTVVTGAGSGLGRALCLEVARRGSARIVVSDIDAEGAEATAEMVRQAGSTAVVQITDVREREQVLALAAFAKETFGDTDLLCNNAGVAVGGPFELTSDEHWQWIVDINLWGVIYGCQAFLPGMRAAGRGRVINVASAAGLLSAPQMSAYNVTKSAVVGLSETLYAEYRSAGVNVSVLCPTFFQTNILENGRGPQTRDTEFARGLMERSKVQAPEVAKQAIDAVEAGRLYCLPMADGRFLWRLKRLSPANYYRFMRVAQGWLVKK